MSTSTARCRAKNPSACKSPRCPARKGGIPGSPARATSTRDKKSPNPSTSTENVPESPLIPIGKDHLILMNEEVKASEKHMSQLSPEEKEAVFDYTNQEYDVLNRSLLRNSHLSPHHALMVQRLDRAFEKTAARDTQPKRLYRKIRTPDTYESADDWISDKLKVGSRITFPSYSSASRSLRSTAAMLRPVSEKPSLREKKSIFAMSDTEWEEIEHRPAMKQNVVLEIETSQGLSVSSNSHMPQETEVLLPRGQTFVITAVEKSTYTTNSSILTGAPEEEKRYPVTIVRMRDVTLGS